MVVIFWRLGMTNLEIVQQEISKMTAEQFSEVFSGNSVKYLCSKIPSAQCIYNTFPFGTCAECIAEHLKLCGWLGELKRIKDAERAIKQKSDD